MLLHFGNLESRCGFSYDGLPFELAYVGTSGVSRSGDDAVIGMV